MRGFIDLFLEVWRCSTFCAQLCPKFNSKPDKRWYYQWIYKIFKQTTRVYLASSPRVLKYSGLRATLSFHLSICRSHRSIMSNNWRENVTSKVAIFWWSVFKSILTPWQRILIMRSIYCWKTYPCFILKSLLYMLCWNYSIIILPCLTGKAQILSKFRKICHTLGKVCPFCQG